MNKKKIEKMVSSLVQQVDYDIWKSLYDKECIEDPEGADEQKDALEAIATAFVEEIIAAGH